MARGSAGETSLRKHLRIIEAFDAQHLFLNLTEIAAAAGLAKSSAHRLVSELVREGLLERMPDRSYRLGVRLWEFGSRTPGGLGLRELSRPWLNAVHERVGQHAQLGVLSGHDILFIERLSTPDAVINATLIGGRMPAYSSSGGLVLLAHTDDTVVDDIIDAGIRPLTPHAISSGPELRAAIARVRSSGFAVTDGYIHPDSRGIAVPVRTTQGAVVASMSVVVPNDGHVTAPFVELLQWAAMRTARSLDAAYHPGSIGEPAHPRAALFAGVSDKSLAYLESLAATTGTPSGIPRVK